MRTTFTFGKKAQQAFALVLVCLGLYAAVYGWKYGLGQLNDIGPGAFPFGIGIVLMLLSGIAFLEDTVRTFHQQRDLRPLLFLPAGISLWALLIEPAGLLIANAALIAMMSFAKSGSKLSSAVLLTICLTIGGYIVLVMGFNLPFHIFVVWP
jgi:putative tricarboxylic transport membrane protein